MKLTAEDNPETIKRYRHIKPARPWGPRKCAARLGSTSRVCTLGRDHNGPHVAHGSFGRVMAVWDEGVALRTVEEKPRTSAKAIERTRFRRGGPIAALGDLWGRVIKDPNSYMEEGLLLIFFLGMVAFVIDWMLRILAGG